MTSGGHSGSLVRFIRTAMRRTLTQCWGLVLEEKILVVRLHIPRWWHGGGGHGRIGGHFNVVFVERKRSGRLAASKDAA